MMTDTAAKTLGFILWFILVMLCYFKMLRDNKRLIILLLVASLFAVYAFILRENGQPFSGRYRGSNFLFSPFLYVLSYGILRYLYKDTYKREPTYDRHSWHDVDEGRDQNVFDVIVFVFPLFFSVLFPFLIS